VAGVHRAHRVAQGAKVDQVLVQGDVRFPAAIQRAGETQTLEAGALVGAPRPPSGLLRLVAQPREMVSVEAQRDGPLLRLAVPPHRVPVVPGVTGIAAERLVDEDNLDRPVEAAMIVQRVAQVTSERTAGPMVLLSKPHAHGVALPVVAWGQLLGVG